MFLVETNRTGRARLCRFFAAPCRFTATGISYMGKAIVAHFEDLWADFCAKAATNTEIMIHFWIQRSASSP
ncbi:MAG: hypothetical protein AA931_12040 [Peptococcaceae bacterium 1109]|jgi:hypothetical protein|nr:MAG: hypothetical protein AA931_12040 [Peptococcaceae bacterium 1109]